MTTKLDLTGDEDNKLFIAGLLCLAIGLVGFAGFWGFLIFAGLFLFCVVFVD